MIRTAGVMLIVGSTIFGIGAALGVPRVFTTRDRQARLRLLEQHRRAWQFAQPFYAVGPVIAAVGIAVLAADLDALARVSCLIAAAALLVGASTWSYGCYLRGARPADFALGNLPGWLFATYVVGTIAGLGLLAFGIVAADHPLWLGWFVLAADLAFLVLYVATRDIPPFVFYLLLTVVGVVLIFDAS